MTVHAQYYSKENFLYVFQVLYVQQNIPWYFFLIEMTTTD